MTHDPSVQTGNEVTESVTLGASQTPPHDPLCDWRPCTCPLDYDVPERGHMIGCPEDDCECEIIAKVRADEQAKQREEMTSLLLEARSRTLLGE